MQYIQSRFLTLVIDFSLLSFADSVERKKTSKYELREGCMFLYSKMLIRGTHSHIVLLKERHQ